MQYRLPHYASVNRIVLYERGKKREIVPITIWDRMLQRVLCDNALIPVLESKLIYDNGASMKGKGVDFARKRLMHHLHKATLEFGSDFYALVFDFKIFFDSIPHQTCFNILNENFKDKHIVNLTMDIIKSYEKSQIWQIKDADIRREKLNNLNANKSKGICLGSQVSQILALVVPNKLDHFIKDHEKVKHYMRYMDDGIIFAKSKSFLKKLFSKMKEICKELGLIFNEKKTAIVKAAKGFTFMKVKYRVTETGKIIRKLTRAGIVRMRRKLKKFKRKVDSGDMTLDDVFSSMQSWLEHSKIAMSYNTRKSMLKLYDDLFDGYKITNKWKRMKGGKDGEILQTDKCREFRWDCIAA